MPNRGGRPRKLKNALTRQIRAFRCTKRMATEIERERRLLTHMAGQDVSTAEAVRRLLWRGIGAAKAPGLRTDVDEVT